MRFLAAGFLGVVAHATLMYLKAKAGILPNFQPYLELQQKLSELVGTSIHPAVPWLVSFINGAVVLRFVFGRVYGILPGRGGLAKGFVFGVLGWFAMGLLVLPWLGRGVFASEAGHGALPAIFSLMMVLTYSMVMGLVYSALKPRRGRGLRP